MSFTHPMGTPKQEAGDGPRDRPAAFLSPRGPSETKAAHGISLLT